MLTLQGALSLPLYIGGDKKSSRKITKILNELEYNNELQNLMSTALNQFEYEGLPETVDARMIEMSFLLYGTCAFVELESGVYIGLPCAVGGGVTINGWFNTLHVYGYNGYNAECVAYVRGADDSFALRDTTDSSYTGGKPRAVLGLDNVNAYPYINYCVNTARRLADLQRSADTMVETLKRPYVVTCSEQDVNSVRNILREIRNNEVAVLTAKSITLDSFKLWSTNTNPESLKTIMERYDTVYNQWCECFGIRNNNNPNKKERLLVDEINSNNDITKANAEKRLAYRQRWCEDIKNAFGVDITVKIKEAESDDLSRGLDDLGGMGDPERME